MASFDQVLTIPETLSDLAAWLRLKIAELERWPYQTTADAEYDNSNDEMVEPSDEYVYQQDADAWNYFGHVVRQAATFAAKLGGHDLFDEYPSELKNRQDAIWHLVRVLGWCVVKELSFSTARTIAVDAVGLANILGVSERHIHSLNSRHRLPKPVQLGGSVRWYVKEIEAWLSVGAPNREKWEKLKSKVLLP